MTSTPASVRARPPHPARLASAFAVGLAAALFLASALGATVTAGGDVSVWDSDVPVPAGPPDPGTTIFPIGGSGQVNGEFVFDTVELGPSALQVGLRAQERFQGPTWSRVGNVYFATSGSPNLDGRASWNYEIHLDFGTTDADTTLPGQSLESQTLSTLVPLNLRDYEVEFLFDGDPSAATDFTVTDFNEVLTTGGAGPDVRLFQTSQNPDFDVFGGGGLFDAELEGTYDLGLRVSDPETGAVVAASFIQVVVVDSLPADPAAETVDVSLGVTESTDPVLISAGAPGALTYTATLANAGPAAATNVQVSAQFTLPAGVTLDGDPVPSTGSVAGGGTAFTWDLATLASGAGATLTADLTVADTAELGVDVIAVALAIVSVDEPDRNLFNQAAAATTSIDCPDADGDGVCDADDNCPAIGNPGQEDGDGDGNGNACDLCFGDDTTGDSDADGVCDEIDFCLGNDLTGDADMDGLCADRDCDEGDPLNACLVFFDGFETGDFLRWSSTEP